MNNVSTPNGSQALKWYGLALVIVLLDQWTKHVASLHLEYGRPLEVLPILNMTLQFNAGAAFSFLSDATGWQRWFFTGIAAVVSLVLAIWLYRMPRAQQMLACSLALILGGALGNLVDRLVLGYVVDFISVHYETAYFPTFNAADSAITVGAALMILDSILHPIAAKPSQ